MFLLLLIGNWDWEHEIKAGKVEGVKRKPEKRELKGNLYNIKLKEILRINQKPCPVHI